jgi:hypothetical protein
MVGTPCAPCHATEQMQAAVLKALEDCDGENLAALVRVVDSS